MLKYIEKSTDDNVTNQDIASIQQLVNKVKHKKEVGINYMKSWEMEKIAHDEGYQDGFKEGFNDGFSDGFNDGFSDGAKDATEKMRQLILRLSEAGRMDDIVKAASDTAYQEQLLKEFNL